MRFIETCSCGASVEIIYTAPNSPYSTGEKREEKEALKQMAIFQKRHQACFASTQESERQ